MQSVEIISRAGKLSGKNRNWRNIENLSGNQQSLNFEKIHHFELIDTNDNTNDPELLEKMSRLSLENIPKSVETSQDETQIHETLKEKQFIQSRSQTKEQDQWKKERVYTEHTNQGQDCISLRWVLKEKFVDDKKIIKARLCVRGFEEEQCFPFDSPTCCKEGLRLACCVISSNKWLINSLDVKTVFLQGKPIERTVFVLPPKEAKTDMVWELKKRVYGLADASRCWYLKVREELIRLGAIPIQLNQIIFIWHKDNKPIGIMACFADDVLWGGNNELENIVNKSKQMFYISSKHKQVFDYIGIKLEETSDFSIIVTQKDYIDTINPVEFNKDDLKNPKCKFSQEEITILRGILEKRNWVAGMTKPEISFFV